MENASKALIIAGAILISIVLISVSIAVVNSMDPSQATNQADQLEVDSFNSQFLSKEGTNKKGSDVTALINTIISNNTKFQNDDIKKIDILVDGVTDSAGTAVSAAMITDGTAIKDFSEAANAIRRAIKTSSTYEIQVDTDLNTGYVNSIKIIYSK